MNEEVYFFELDRCWRRRVCAYGLRGFPRLSDEDIDEAYNSALLRFWKRGHRMSVKEAGGLLCLCMQSVCSDLDDFYKAKRRERGRSVRLGLFEKTRGKRLRRVPLYEEVVHAASVLGSAESETLRAIEGAISVVTLDGCVSAEAAEVAGVPRTTMAGRIARLRRDLSGGLDSAAWRGPDGCSLEFRSKARGKTVAAVCEHDRARGFAAAYAA